MGYYVIYYIFYTLYNVHYTLYVHSTMYSVQCSVLCELRTSYTYPHTHTHTHIKRRYGISLHYYATLVKSRGDILRNLFNRRELRISSAKGHIRRILYANI